MPDIKIRAFLCSHRDFLKNTLPCPEGVEIRFTKEGYSDTSAVTVTTSAEGLAQSAAFEAGSTYTVEIPGTEWELWEPERPTVTMPGKTLDIKLVPTASRYPVVLRLSRDQLGGDPVDGASVQIQSADDILEYRSRPDGRVYGVAPEGTVTLHFESCTAAGQQLVPEDPDVTLPVLAAAGVDVRDFIYRSAIQISIKPTVIAPDGSSAPLAGASVTVEYRASTLAMASSTTSDLAAGEDAVTFNYAFPGVYVVTVTPSPVADGWPIKNGPTSLPAQYLNPGGSLEREVPFDTAAPQTIKVQVSTPQGEPLTSQAHLLISGPGDITVRFAATTDQLSADVPSGAPLSIQLDPDAAAPAADGIPLQMSGLGQTVVGSPGTNIIKLGYQHSIIGRAVDEQDRPVPGAVIDVFGDGSAPLKTVVADEQGSFEVGLAKEGTYYLAQNPAGGTVGIRERVEVHSTPNAQVHVRMRAEGGGAGAEALTDLSAYPVLTEEITTTGVPTPTGGGPGGGGGPGAGYGQTVDQVMRDVLGWRPSGDLTGFQAALTGAFQLREVEGHTEWSWQQRGYAVQADMGALTGAQASIYARAKSALDQIQPLLASLTPINPALYPPQDLEAIRTVISAELQELVNELALEGGPRIQRVDELFGLLLEDSIGSTNLNPDLIKGQLGTLRDRFGLTVDEIDTVDEERIVTNFRIVVEQVLTLQASWSTDRELLSGVNSRTSLGTILIWLSRGLEAVCESVNDLTFALDSVYVDAAQRQVIELNFARQTIAFPAIPLRARKSTSYQFPREEPPLLLSDLLDWVLRASRDEGPRIIQDAGKDGVFAFAPVLDKLRTLIYATRDIARSSAVLPPGMRTPRVRRALAVLAGQLDEATDLARLVRRDEAPQLFTALAGKPDEATGRITVTLTGANFRRGATVVLIPENREDLADLTARHISVQPPSVATAKFRNPRTAPAYAGVTWLAMLTNENGTESNPVTVQF